MSSNCFHQVPTNRVEHAGGGGVTRDPEITKVLNEMVHLSNKQDDVTLKMETMKA
jgi:hypothetical protein